jgi:hypothetical protein
VGLWTDLSFGFGFSHVANKTMGIPMVIVVFFATFTAYNMVNAGRKGSWVLWMNCWAGRV